jgi:hypothetical protein
MAQINDDTLTLFIPVWGAKHIGLLQEFTLPSLMSPGNLPGCALKTIYVQVGGIVEEWDQIRDVISQALPGLPLQIELVGSPIPRDPIHALRGIIHTAVIRGSRMLVTMPDTIFAPNCVTNLMAYAKGKPVTVAAAHVRVNEELYFSRYGKRFPWLTHRDMVKAAFDMGAVDVCDSNKDNVTEVGGIAWTRINEDTRLLLHYLPTPYLCWFTPTDEDFWAKAPTFGHWDHIWPSLLLNERRLRVAGSSETFFLIELEAAARSGSLRPAPGSAGKELYNHRHPHNDACGAFCIEVKG